MQFECFWRLGLAGRAVQSTSRFAKHQRIGQEKIARNGTHIKARIVPHRDLLIRLISKLHLPENQATTGASVQRCPELDWLQ